MAEEIRTAAELDALPVGSVVRETGGGYVWQRRTEGWYPSCADMAWDADQVLDYHDRRVTVLYRPDAPQQAPAADLRYELNLALRTIQRQIDDILSILGEDAASVTVDGEVNLDLMWEMLAAGYVPVAKRAPQPTPVGDDVVERAARAVYERIEAHWPGAFDGCDSNDTECEDGEDCAADVARAALAAARAGESVLPGCTGDYGCPAPAHQHGCMTDTEGHCNDPADHAAQRGGTVVDREALVDLLLRVGHVEWDRADAGAVADHLLALLAARGEAAPSVSAEQVEVAAERARQVGLGYDDAHDDRRGALTLARFAGNYLARGIEQGNRSDLIKAAGLLEAAAASFRRLGQPLGIGVRS